jgi:chemotaxis protein histidine kinase CheA
MDEIIVDFKVESKDLIKQMLQVLNEIEGEFDKREKLETFGQVVDRIMGGADTLVMVLNDSEQIVTVARYAQMCKLVGYKASQLENEPLYNIVIAFLLDAVEMLEKIVDRLGTDREIDLKTALPKTFLDRLKWVANKFDSEARGSIAVEVAEKEATDDQQILINDILKGIGIN